MTTSEPIFDTIHPGDLGLPAKYTDYRVPQREAMEWVANECEHPIHAACMPTGIGKTVLAMSLARYFDAKTIYCVATKALQEQVQAEFRSMGVCDIRGRANYTCPNYHDCERGYDENCSLMNTTGCRYTVASEAAKDADIVVTNYAYWLHARRHNPHALERDGRPVELLILDEAHSVESQMTGFYGVHFSSSEIGRATDLERQLQLARCGTDGQMPNDEWTQWAKDKINKLEDSNDVAIFQDDDKDMVDRCRRVIRMGSNWVWQFDDKGHVAFEPVRLTSFTRSLLSGVPRALMMSASLTPFQCDLILPQHTKYDYRAWNPVFPPQNAPFYHIPCKKLSRNSTDEDYKEVIQRADEIIDPRLDRKGIIHTVSYARTRQALQHSRHVGRFFWNETGRGLSDALARFRRSERGGVLVTPSVEEGFDFPGAQCEYQIILKFPFPNEAQRVVKERCNLIPNYRLAYAAQKIVQMKGRPIRHMHDRAECFILDNAVKQLTGPSGKALLPPGFRIFTVTSIPSPPPRINQ